MPKAFVLYSANDQKLLEVGMQLARSEPLRSAWSSDLQDGYNQLLITSAGVRMLEPPWLDPVLVEWLKMGYFGSRFDLSS
jgi:hypothetical protein